MTTRLGCRHPDPRQQSPRLSESVLRNRRGSYVTNFSPHYDGDDLSQRGSWLGLLPAYVRHPMAVDFAGLVQPALNSSVASRL
jgi:hypothetical protein